MKRLNKKGFTMAELLIVVAIIAVLVAIAIPVFTSSLKKSQARTDEANARSLYANLQADYLSADNAASYTAASFESSYTSTATTVTGASGTLTLSSGETVKLQNSASSITIQLTSNGWKVTYECTDPTIDKQTWGGN